MKRIKKIIAFIFSILLLSVYAPQALHGVYSVHDDIECSDKSSGHYHTEQHECKLCHSSFFSYNHTFGHFSHTIQNIRVNYITCFSPQVTHTFCSLPNFRAPPF